MPNWHFTEPVTSAQMFPTLFPAETLIAGDGFAGGDDFAGSIVCRIHDLGASEGYMNVLVTELTDFPTTSSVQTVWSVSPGPTGARSRGQMFGSAEPDPVVFWQDAEALTGWSAEFLLDFIGSPPYDSVADVFDNSGLGLPAAFPAYPYVHVGGTFIETDHNDFTIESVYLTGVGPELTVNPVVRLFPRDDSLGLGSAPRLYPPPRGGRVVGGFQ